jgi:hypothetical protein
MLCRKRNLPRGEQARPFEISTRTLDRLLAECRRLLPRRLRVSGSTSSRSSQPHRPTSTRVRVRSGPVAGGVDLGNGRAIDYAFSAAVRDDGGADQGTCSHRPEAGHPSKPAAHERPWQRFRADELMRSNFVAASKAPALFTRAGAYCQATTVGRSDEGGYLMGNIRCSYGVPGHMTYGLLGSALASRGYPCITPAYGKMVFAIPVGTSQAEFCPR